MIINEDTHIYIHLNTYMDIKALSPTNDTKAIQIILFACYSVQFLVVLYLIKL